MKRAKSFSRIQILLLSLLSSVVIPSNAGAQPAAVGKFTLSSQARWGGLILPPGEYTYGLEQNAPMPMVMVYSTSGVGKGIVFAAFVSEMKTPGPGKVTLENIGGETVITALYIESLGMVLHYQPAKARVEMARKKQLPAREVASYSQVK